MSEVEGDTQVEIEKYKQEIQKLKRENEKLRQRLDESESRNSTLQDDNDELQQKLDEYEDPLRSDDEDDTREIREDLLQKCYQYIDRLGMLCAKAAKIDSQSLPPARTIINDDLSMEFLLGRLESGLEISRIEMAQLMAEIERQQTLISQHTISEECKKIIHDFKKQLSQLTHQLQDDPSGIHSNYEEYEEELYTSKYKY